MKKTAKKLLCSVLIISMVLGLSSCGKTMEITEENVSQTVDTVAVALREFDTKTLKKYVSSSTLSMIIGYAEDKEQFCTLGKEIFKDLTMEIVSTDIENETVTLKITNKKMENAAENFVNELMSQYSAIELLGKLSDDAFLNEYLPILLGKIDNCIFTMESTVTLKVDKDKKNLVLVFDDEGENAVSGGVTGAIKSMFD